MTTETTKTQPRSIAHSTELFALKKQIKASHEVTELLTKTVREKSRELITEAVVGGAALARVREILGPREFPVWLEQNVRGLSAEQATVFTVLAKSGEQLETRRGYVDALRALEALQ
jgi:hypothetical protein